tara:strand:+ start:1404 stop:1700 length:297 start_codon:yes stop_codon:yes gene_type:complete
MTLGKSQTPPCTLGVVYINGGHTSRNPEDYIEIYNFGTSDCSLEGFQLDNNIELEDFTFGQVILKANDFSIGYEDQDTSFASSITYSSSFKSETISLD